jgi:hypothetical protein
MSKSEKLGIAPTMKVAAGRSGYSVEVLKRAKSEGCPAFDPSGRVDVDGLVEWIESNVHVLQLDPVSLLEYETKLAKKNQAVFAYQKEKGEYIALGDLTDALKQNQARLKSLLQKALCQELPQKGAMQDAPALRILGEQLLDGVCEQMRKGVEKWIRE